MAEKRFVIPDLLTSISVMLNNFGNSKVQVSLNLSQNAYTITGRNRFCTSHYEMLEDVTNIYIIKL
jgi:hypothetical protein